MQIRSLSLSLSSFHSYALQLCLRKKKKKEKLFFGLNTIRYFGIIFLSNTHTRACVSVCVCVWVCVSMLCKCLFARFLFVFVCRLLFFLLVFLVACGARKICCLLFSAPRYACDMWAKGVERQLPMATQ